MLSYKPSPAMTSMFTVQPYGKAKLAVLEKHRASPYNSPSGGKGARPQPAAPARPRLAAPPWKTAAVAPWRAPAARPAAAAQRTFSAPSRRPPVAPSQAPHVREALAAPGGARRATTRSSSSGAARSAGSVVFSDIAAKEAEEAEEGDEDARQCMVYVGNLAYSANFYDLSSHMSTAGPVAFARVHEDLSGALAGSGCVCYESAADARRAIEELDGSTLKWREIKVEAWTGKVSAARDWRDLDLGPDPDAAVFVGKLHWRTKSWQVKEHMEQAGPVDFCRVLTHDNKPWGESKCIAFVRFESAAGAQQAKETLSGSELLGRQLVVDAWGSKLESFQAPSVRGQT